MGSRANYSGLVIAGIGFFLTRFTVTLAAYEDPVRFYFAGVVPLALGLGLAAVGVALVVADVDRDLVRTTAIWCVTGAVAMLVLVVLTLLGSMTGGMPDFQTMQSRTYLSNFLIGGSVGGTLTGLYASRNRRHREALQQQARRLDILNRLLRHEVLNAVAVIRGYATLDADETEAREMIDRRSAGIERTIDEVKYLTGDPGDGGDPIRVRDALDEALAAVRDRYPAAEITVDGAGNDLFVHANERLSRVFENLLDNGVVYAGMDEPRVEVGVTASDRRVAVSISDTGPGLPLDQRALLEEGVIEEFDDPGTGFGLNVVRLLVETYGGEIRTDVDADGTTITVELRRVTPEDAAATTGLAGERPSVPHLAVTLVAALAAGMVYGVVAETLGGSVSVIGVFYGIEHAVVGWLTHEFHSVVFGFVFAGLVSIAPARYRDSLPAYVAIGVGWGLALWFIAAGVISPIWLRLLGIPASIPSLSGLLLVTHVTWGVTLAVLCALGYRYLTPWLAALDARIRRRLAA